MKRAWILLPIAALATLVILPLTTMGDEEPPEPSIFAVDLGADFTYQGRFNDGDEAADGVYDLRFILYDAESGGTQVGETVTKDNIIVQDGFFTTTLNFGAAAFNGDARWLEIAVRRGDSLDTFTVLNPRQPVTAVPYALHALTSGGFAVPVNLAGADVGSILQVSQTDEGRSVEVFRSDSDVFTPSLFVRNDGAGPAVSALSTDPTGIGVLATAEGAFGTAGSFNGTTALEVDGAIRTGVENPPAFKVVADVGTNTCDAGGPDDALIIDSALANDDPFAMIFLTADGSGAFPDDATYFVLYDAPGDCPADTWVIRRSDGGPWLDDQAFNVLVISQTVIQ